MTEHQHSDSSSYAAATAVTSQLIFHSNRHITAVMADGTEYQMRPPSIDKWQVIGEAYAWAFEMMKLPGDVRGSARKLFGRPEDATRPDGEQAAEPAPYAEAFAVALHQTANVTVAAGELPLWTGDPDLFMMLLNHWRNLKFVIEPSPEDTADTPPGGHGMVATSNDPAPAPAPTPDDGRDGLPVFDPTSGTAVSAGMAPGPGAGNIAPPPPQPVGG